jgi:hypothetical protein
MTKPVFKQPGASKNYAAPSCWNATDARTNGASQALRSGR